MHFALGLFELIIEKPIDILLDDERVFADIEGELVEAENFVGFGWSGGIEPETIFGIEVRFETPAKISYEVG